ncbi:MAG TPA: hypothetical protein VI197_00745 [Polyangiaceae bacterium]
MADRRTPTDPEAREAESIHDTQTSLPLPSSAPRSPAPETPADADTLLSGPAPEDELHAEVGKRLSALEGALVEMQARVRLLEKQNAAPNPMVYWFLALLFFVVLAVSWRLIAHTR